MKSLLLLVLALSALVTGCNLGTDIRPSEVVVQTDQPTYRTGEMILVRTVNESEDVVFDDHCGGTTEGWELIHQWNSSRGFGRSCAYALGGNEPRPLVPPRHTVVPIPPHTVHTDTFVVGAFAYTGSWRISLLLLDGDFEPLPEQFGRSNIFRVQGSYDPCAVPRKTPCTRP